MPEVILVCLPTFHGPLSWLTRAVDSLKKQTWKTFECWVVKDGCDAGARWRDRFDRNSVKECNNCKARIEYMQKIVAEDERFLFWTLPCNFAAYGWGPRNFILLNTAHDIIAYLDDDDWWEPSHLCTCLGCLHEKKVDFVFSGSKIFNEQSQVIEERLQPNRCPANCVKRVYDRQSYEIVVSSEIMHRRALFVTFGGWRYTKGCDWDLLNRWTQMNAKWAYTGRHTVNQTAHIEAEPGTINNEVALPYRF